MHLFSVKKIKGSLKEAWHWVMAFWKTRRVEKRKPILVYQMGKVGSSSVVKTLEGLHLQHPVFHVHTLQTDRIQWAIKRERSTRHPFLPEHLIHSYFLAKKLAKGTFPCYIITLTREPIGRLISFVFEDLSKQAPDAKNEDGLDTGKILEAIHRKLQKPSGHTDPGIWFDEEIKSIFGIDALDIPETAKESYFLHKERDLSLLVLRMEDLNTAMSPGLSALLELGDAQAVPPKAANVSTEKWYASEIGLVKSKLKVEPVLFKKLTSTRYFRKFYENDADRLFRKWVKP